MVKRLCVHFECSGSHEERVEAAAVLVAAAALKGSGSVQAINLVVVGSI